MPDDIPHVRSIDFEWTGVDALPLHFVNQIVSQLGVPGGQPPVPDSIQLTFGIVTQPILVGSPESVARQAEQLQSVPVQAVARLGMSRERAEELLQILAQTLAQYDAAREAAKHDVRS